jgi:hypothetical protein
MNASQIIYKSLFGERSSTGCGAVARCDRRTDRQTLGAARMERLPRLKKGV